MNILENNAVQPGRAGVLQNLPALPAGFLVALLLACASSALADTITLRTGERLVGKVVSENQKKMVFESQGLGRVEIPREGIERIQREQPPPKPAPLPPPEPFQPPSPVVKPTAASPALTNAPATTAASTNQPDKEWWLWRRKLYKGESNSDWIQLKSGEWLRGRLYGMQNRSVEFESDELDDLQFDWKDVHQMHLPRALVSYGQRQTAAGALRVDQQTVTITGAEPLSFPREELIGVAPGQMREIDYWSGKFNVGINVSAGNTEQADVVTKVRLERRTPNTHLKLDYTGNYSETENVQTGESLETVNNQRFNGVFNRFLTRRLFLVTPLVEYYSDEFQNIDRQITFGAGAGYYFIDRPNVEWLVLGGPGLQRVRFDTVQAGEDLENSTPAFFLQSTFEIDLTKRVDLELGYQAIVTSEDAGRLGQHTTATLEIDLTRRLDLDITFTWDRTEIPRADSSGDVPEQNDFRLNVSLGLKF